MPVVLQHSVIHGLGFFIYVQHTTAFRILTGCIFCRMVQIMTFPGKTNQIKSNGSASVYGTGIINLGRVVQRPIKLTQD